ncbi:hypothetical protein O1611_g2589 [Lasiodiplodia mahajangana]|uniref:Uncharacterized protein n=1 Tax=Lasiodiplodia mahajangana TaxID=1108764 RepID=A0ACC2JUN3_9PEZI|nr:hypothetical protein O1611_g2589 [Lasiodiplodia mahajangana]
MARLNEPTVSTDNLEALRRRFLRQNRDIARTNSTQSLKIRNLENECARLLSENLQLRSEILRLNTELEGSHAHRVANHALQIKEKMEAQLLEWGTMLADLGHEPVPKNRSPRALKKAKIQRNSIGRTRTSDWRRRETMGSMEDLEAAALQEGRLPPLWENKTYPRETLNRDEILALCSEAEESTDSPDIGPPPVSRFVDEDPVKLDLSTLTKLLTPALTESDASGPEDAYPDSPVASVKTHDVVKKAPEGYQAEKAEETTKGAPESELQTPVQAAKANLKRKVREEDEKENAPLSKPLLPVSAITKNNQEKITNEKANTTTRPIKDLPIGKRDPREKSFNATQRKPLGAKSSNEALGSLKKSAKAPTEGKGAKPKAEGKDDEPTKGHLKPPKEPKTVDIPPPSSPEPVSRVDIEPESLSAEPNLAVPDSPEVSVPREKINDTPPPLDISSKGETTRANRRARAAVSYAEPNLRDKMRRPNTKQLFDAVAGEGKNIRRTSQCQREEPSSGPFSGAKSESSRKNATSQQISNDMRSDPDIMASPLIQKTTRTSTLEQLPASVTTDRKRKDLTTAAQDHGVDATAINPITKGINRRLEQIAAREAEVAELFERSDVYEFTDSSLNDTSKETIPEENKITKGGRQSRSRRFSSITPEGVQLSNANQNEKAPSKQTGSRKRASMAAIKSTRSDLEDSRGESPSVDGDSVSSAEGDRTTREKATSSRRRTTMI